MKTINCNGRNVEITAIRFTYADETTIQDGVLLHDTTDEFSDGDTIYGNGWTIDMVNDDADVENLLTSTDGTTYFTRNDDGSYHIDA